MPQTWSPIAAQSGLAVGLTALISNPPEPLALSRWATGQSPVTEMAGLAVRLVSATAQNVLSLTAQL